MSLISDLFSNQPAQDAANTGQMYRLAGLTGATNQLQGGTTAASNYLDTAANTYAGSKAYYAPLTPGAQSAWDAYTNLVTGDPATQKAVLENQAGFQASMDEAMQGANRAAAAGGMGNSGNALIAASDRARALEEGNINNYASRLLALAGYAPQLAGALTGINTQIGGTQAQQAALQQWLASQEAGLTSSAWNATAQDQENAILARQAAASNVWNAIMGTLGLTVKGFTGGAGGGPTPFQNIGKMFSA